MKVTSEKVVRESDDKSQKLNVAILLYRTDHKRKEGRYWIMDQKH